MSTDRNFRPSAATIARAIRHTLSGYTKPFPTLDQDTLYQYLCRQEDMFSHDESVWAELANISAPSSSTLTKRGTVTRDGIAGASMDVCNETLSPLQLTWGEVKSSVGEGKSSQDGQVFAHTARSFSPNALQAMAMRRWPAQDALIHFVFTWYGYSIYIPRSAMERTKSCVQEQSCSEVVARLADAMLRTTSMISVLLGQQGLTAILAHCAAQQIVQICISKEGRALLEHHGATACNTAFGVILSATWLAPFIVQARRWDARETSLPQVIVTVRGQSKEAKTSVNNTTMNDTRISPRLSTTDPSRCDSPIEHCARSNVSAVPPLPNSLSTPPTIMNAERTGSDIFSQSRIFSRLIRRPHTPSHGSIKRTSSQQTFHQTSSSKLMKAKRPTAALLRAPSRDHDMSEHPTTRLAFNMTPQRCKDAFEVFERESSTTSCETKVPKIVHIPGFKIEQSVEVYKQKIDVQSDQSCPVFQMQGRYGRRSRNASCSTSLKTNASDISRMTGFADAYGDLTDHRRSSESSKSSIASISLQAASSENSSNSPMLSQPGGSRSFPTPEDQFVHEIPMRKGLLSMDASNS